MWYKCKKLMCWKCLIWKTGCALSRTSTSPPGDAPRVMYIYIYILVKRLLLVCGTSRLWLDHSSVSFQWKVSPSLCKLFLTSLRGKHDIQTLTIYITIFVENFRDIIPYIYYKKDIIMCFWLRNMVLGRRYAYI